MEQYPIMEFLDRLPFFKEFTNHEKVKLVDNDGIFEKYEDGDTIVKEGDKGSAIFVVLTGSIRITRTTGTPVQQGHISLQQPEEITIAELKPGSIFGEVSMISKQPRNTNALVNSQEVVVMKITQEVIESFNSVVQRKFQTQLIMTLVNRLNDMNSKYIKLKSNPHPT